MLVLWYWHFIFINLLKIYHEKIRNCLFDLDIEVKFSPFLLPNKVFGHPKFAYDACFPQCTYLITDIHVHRVNTLAYMKAD